MPGLSIGNNPTTQPEQSTCRDTTHNPTTINSNESSDRNNQHKKLHREAGGEQPKFDKKTMGLIHLRNPEINSLAVFPRI